MPVTPISPSDVKVRRLRQLPDLVIKAWNDMIFKNIESNQSRFGQSSIIDAIAKEMLVEKSDVITNKWLDIEDIYSNAGWLVTQHHCCLSESWSTYYLFKARESDEGNV